MEEWYIWIFGIIAVFILLWYTYTNNDCINGKECIAYVDIQPTDSPAVIKDKIQQIADKANPIVWPLALAVSIAISIPSIYYVTGRNPTIWEFLAVTLICFIAVFFVYSWLQVHFYQPNLNRIVDAVNYL